MVIVGESLFDFAAGHTKLVAPTLPRRPFHICEEKDDCLEVIVHFDAIVPNFCCCGGKAFHIDGDGLAEVKFCGYEVNTIIPNGGCFRAFCSLFDGGEQFVEVIFINGFEGDAVGQLEDWVSDGLPHQGGDAFCDSFFDADGCQAIAVAIVGLVLGAAGGCEEFRFDGCGVGAGWSVDILPSAKLVVEASGPKSRKKGPKKHFIWICMVVARS